MMEFRGKITFLGYIYYLTVSNDEYHALSAWRRRYKELYCRGALLHVVTPNRWSLSQAGRCKASSPLHHVMFSGKISMLCSL